MKLFIWDQKYIPVILQLFVQILFDMIENEGKLCCMTFYLHELILKPVIYSYHVLSGLGIR